MDSNSYFDIHPSTGLISLIDNAFPSDLRELTLKVYATATLNQLITGVYAEIMVDIRRSFGSDFADIGGDGVPDMFQDTDGDGVPEAFEDYSAGDDVFFNYDNDFEFDANYSAILNDITREFVLDGSTSAEYNFDQDTHVKEFKLGDGKIINKKNLKTVEEMIFGNGRDDSTEFNMTEANTPIEAGQELKFGGEGDFMGTLVTEPSPLKMT